MKLNLIYLVLFTTNVFGSGGYDHGTSAGKGNWDISLTWNPFNYFEQGQSYAVLGYGLTNRLDIHCYYSSTQNGGDNYYGGLSYQFLDTKYLDLSTSIGMRAYKENNDLHLFLPQLLYTLRISDRMSIGGSAVNIMEDVSWKMGDGIGVALDMFLMVKVYENKKCKIDVTAGGFNPVLWDPKGGEWYPTYSIDIKIKK